MKSRLDFIILFCIFLISLTVQTVRSDSIERLGAIKTGSPWDNQAVGNYVYLANRAATVIIDISDSTNPVLTYSTTGSLQWSLGLFVQDSLIFVIDWGDFWIGRLFPPDSIKFITWYDLPNSMLPEPWGIEARDTILYIANSGRGLYIFNVKDPTNPTLITVYDTPHALTEFFILDTLIYLADGDSVIILNISNPASPQHVGAVDIPGIRWCRDVHVVYPYAYATAYSSAGTDGRIYIIDVSTPSNPTIVGMIDEIRGDPRAVFVNDDYIYIASWSWDPPIKKENKGRPEVKGGISVAQGIVPDSLIISYDTLVSANEVFVRGNLLLVPAAGSLQVLYHHKTGIAEEGKRKTPLISKFFVFPNPAKDRITCKLQFKKSARIILGVYDELGRKTREIYRGPIIPGSMRFFWDGRDNNRKNVPSGEYFITISTTDGKYNESKKVIYLGGKK